MKFNLSLGRAKSAGDSIKYLSSGTEDGGLGQLTLPSPHSTTEMSPTGTWTPFTLALWR